MELNIDVLYAVALFQSRIAADAIARAQGNLKDMTDFDNGESARATVMLGYISGQLKRAMEAVALANHHIEHAIKLKTIKLHELN